MINDMTQEEREALLVRAREVKEEKKAWAKEHLRDDYADKHHWQYLASKYDVRLPTWYASATESKHVKRVFKKTGMDVTEYVEAMGCSSLRELLSMNKDMPAYAAVGLALEWIDEQKQ